MQLILQDNKTRILRFDRGEEAIQGLIDFCVKEDILAGWFEAIGAAGHLVLSYYNLQDKKYEDHPISEDLEVVSMSGNIGTLNGNVMVHTHGTFSDRKLNVKGGHIKSLKVSATLEVRLTEFSGGPIVREMDEATGLNLMCGN